MLPAYRETIPSPSLSSVVECFWIYQATSSVSTLILPDGCIDILFRLHNTLYEVDIVGSMTHVDTAHIPSGHTYIGIRFKPGMICSVLPLSYEFLVDKIKCITCTNHIFLEKLYPDINRSKSIEEILEILNMKISVNYEPSPIHEALNCMVEKNGSICSEELSDISHLCNRQFSRYCIKLTGLSPKKLSRILRFRKTWEGLQQFPDQSLATLALDCGYYDQAHMIHEFHAMAGMSPSQYIKYLR